MSDPDSAAYVLGHSEGELARLERQGEFYEEFTELVFRKAGIQAGMRVLDIGCGAGDVSLIAARLVGADGHVVGVDRAAAAIDAARKKADARPGATVTFVQGDVDDLEDKDFDAVVGRLILMHIPDRDKTLQSLKGALKPNGIMAFVEMDLTTASVAPPMGLFDEALNWICEAYRRDGVEVDMGSKLFALMSRAGLDPTAIGAVRISGGADIDQACFYLAETVRSLAPRIESLGIAARDRIDIETLATRLKDQALAENSCFFYPRFVGVWGSLSGAR